MQKKRRSIFFVIKTEEVGVLLFYVEGPAVSLIAVAGALY